MRIRQVTQCAIDLLVELARGAPPMCLADLCRPHEIPVDYARNAMRPLVKAKLVRGRTGPHGGYELAMPAHSINLTTILLAMDGEIFNYDNGSLALRTINLALGSAVCEQTNPWTLAELAKLNGGREKP